MEIDNKKLIVKKVDGGAFLFLFGLFQFVGGLFIIFLIIKNAINGDFFRENGWLNLFLLFISVFIIPAGLFALTYAFGDRKIFEINADGIKIKNQMTICWQNIYEIETRKYPGPRMSFYRIKLFNDYDKKQKKSIWFSSDTNPDWTEIIEILSNYTARHNIIST
ncbi:MAG: hypothetical protein ABI402_03835 [Ferruginibacter sp.]